MDNDNIFQLISKTPETAEPDEPLDFDYVIIDRQGNEHYHSGFLLFTSQHIAVMRETPKGALPVFVIPLDQVYLAELIEDDEEEV
jgi:hypothetical protein